MSDLNDQQIDNLIRGHLNDQLDPHVGAASRRFADEIARTKRKHVGALTENPKRATKPQPKFGSVWSLGIVGAALAATMTIVSMRHSSPFGPSPLKNNGGPVRPNPDMQIRPVALPIPGEVNCEWNTVNQGIVRMPDGSSARKLVRTTTDKLTFTNPKNKKTYEVIQPKQETIYVGLKQY